MTDTTVEIIPGPNLPTEFTARIAQPSQPTPSPIPPVGLVEIETAAELIAGPPGPIGPVGPPGPQGSPDTGSQVLAKLVTVDGSGSGLDADLLDGHDSTYFATQSDMTAVQSTNTSQDTAIAGKVAKAGDTMTGPLILAANSTAPLKPPGDNTSTIASTAFVQQEIAPKIGDAPNDANSYERKGGAWIVDPIQADAPNDGTQYVRQSRAWSPVSVPPGTFVGDNPPPSPAVGQLWWQSSSGGLFLYYNDGTSTQWVQVNSTSPAPTSPTLLANEVSINGLSGAQQWTGIAATATEVYMSLANLQTNGTVVPEIRVGSGSLLATGYSGYVTGLSTPSAITILANSTGWKVNPSWNSGLIFRGFVTIRRRGGSNTWIIQSALERSDAAALPVLVGQVPLSGAIDRVGIATTDTYTSTIISVWYR